MPAASMSSAVEPDEITQSPIRSAPMAPMVDRVHHNPRGIERLCKAVIALAMLGESMRDLHHSNRLDGNVGPGIGRDLGAVGV